MMSVCSARMKKLEIDVTWNETVRVGAMTETNSKDVIFINFIQERKFEANNVVTCSSEAICCSCDVRRENGELKSSSCLHHDLIGSNEEFMKRTRDVVKHGQHETGDNELTNKWFDSWIAIGANGSVEVGEEEEEVVICTQMDEEDGKHLRLEKIM